MPKLTEAPQDLPFDKNEPKKKKSTPKGRKKGLHNKLMKKSRNELYISQPIYLLRVPLTT